MPTLRWIRRPKSSASAASIDSSVTSTRSAEAVPDTVAFSSASVVPALQKQSAEARSHAEILVDFQRLIEQARPDGGQKRKRTMSPSAKAAMAAEKKCRTTSKRDLPRGVSKTSSGKRFASRIRLGGTNHYIGTYDGPEQASATYLSVKKDLEDAELITADDVNAVFGAAKKKSEEAVGGFMPRTKRAKPTSERDLPTGVQKIPSGKFQAKIRFGGKFRGIDTFDTPEQASAAYVSVKKDLVEGANLPAGGADKANDLFDAARKRVFIPRRKGAKTNSERGLPTGVYKQPWGKFYSRIQWGGKTRYIGTFDTPEQASAAYVSVKKDLGDIELSALGADEINAAFDAVKREHWRQ